MYTDLLNLEDKMCNEYINILEIVKCQNDAFVKLRNGEDVHIFYSKSCMIYIPVCIKIEYINMIDDYVNLLKD